MIVLDTNVVSELMRPRPSPEVVEWVGEQPARDLYISSITVAEILHGVLLLPTGKRRRSILEATRSMFEVDFEGRVLPFDALAAYLYAEIMAERRQGGRPMSGFDGQIAAVASAARASLATRNVADFEGCGVQVLNPWEPRH